MVGIGAVFQYGVEAVVVLATGYFVVSMWERRSAPTARLLLAVAVLLFVSALGHVVLVHPTPVQRWLVDVTAPVIESPVWLGLLIVVVLLAGGVWFLFTLRYTGRGGRLIPITAAGIVAYWALLVVGGVLGEVATDANVPTGSAGGLVLFLGVYLMGVLMIVGSVLILTTSLRGNAVRVGEAVALAAGGALVAFVPITANTLGEPNAVPVMLSLAVGSFVLAIRRYPAFEAPPVARIAGRDRLIEEMDGPFVVVDPNGRVRDVNAAAERYFDADGEAVLGESFETLLPSGIDPQTVADSEEPVHLETSTGATLTCTGNRITDARDRFFGHLLVFRDVTDRQRRERRLSVLNKLLTGAVSDRMEAVAEAVDPVVSNDADESRDTRPTAVGSTVRAETTGLLDLVAWTRDIERGLATEAADSVAVMPIVREVADSVARDDDVEVTVADAEGIGPATIDPDLLGAVLEMVLTDALERGATTLRLEAVGTDGGPTLHVVARGLATGDADPSGAVVDDDRSQSDLLVETARQAVRHYGGRLSVRRDGEGTRRTTLELPEPAGGREPGTPSRIADDRTAGPITGRREGGDG